MKKITLEEHFLAPGLQFSSAIAGLLNPNFAAQMAAKMSDIEQYRLPEMDRNGIDMQVLSLPPGLQMEKDAATAVKIAKHANDSFAEIVRKHPTRFAALAALPLQNPEAAADELERSVKQLGLKGAMINGHTHGEIIDEQKFWIVWERAEALQVPIYMHPGSTPPTQVNRIYEGYPELLGPTWNWGVEMGTYALRLIFSGLFDTFPKTTLILGHMGEMLPFILWRLDSRAKISPGTRSIKKLPSQYIKENIVITTSGQFAPEPLLCSLITLGADRILFAVDYPFESTEEGVRFIETAPISDGDKEKICHLNAEKLLGL